MRSRWRVVVVAVALLAAVCVASPLHLPLNNPNEGVRVFTVKALVEQHTLAIDDVVRAWGFIDDKATRDGRLYSSKAPLVSLVAAAGYALVYPLTGPLERPTLTRLCRAVGGVLPALLVLALAWWALRRRHSDVDDVAADGTADGAIVDLLIVGAVVGSGVLACLNVFSGHALAAGATLLAVSVAKLREVQRWHAVVVAAALSAATCAEYPAALSLPLALLTIARSPRRLHTAAIMVLVGVVVALPTLAAHTAMFGAPHKTGYSFLESADYRPLVAGTFFGIGAPDPGVLLTVLVSPEFGLFFGSPVLLLGLAGLVVRARRGARLEVAVVVAVLALYLLFIAGFRGWRGGWSVGPRYILELVGLLSPFVVDGARLIPLRGRLAVVALLVAVGVLHSGLAGAFFPHLPEVFAAPIGGYVIPTVVRGFAPDSIPLWLGAPAAVAGAMVAAVVFAPVVVVALVWRQGWVAVAAAVVLPLAALEVWLAPQTAATSLEARRLADNWRPEIGNPYLDDLHASPEATRFAVDRGRELRRSPLRCTGAPRPHRPDVGPGAAVITAAHRSLSAPPQLTIVDDELADHIGPAGGAGVVLTFSDLRKRPGALPCAGDVVIVTRRPLPAPLQAWAARSPPLNLDSGYVRHLQQRPEAQAP